MEKVVFAHEHINAVHLSCIGQEGVHAFDVTEDGATTALDMCLKFGSESEYARPGQPVEIAPVDVLLPSQEGSFINGEVFGVTGGAGVA